MSVPRLLVRLSGIAAGWFCAVAQAATIVVGGLDDVDFGRVSPTSGSLRQSIGLCVGLEAPGLYSLIPQGSGAAGAFELDSGLAQLPFRAFYSDRRNRRGRELKPGSLLHDLRSRKPLRPRGCNGVNARLTIMIDGAQLQSRPSGRFEGTLTLMVSPQ